MRYQLPQFIEVEDKIFGPLTFKQFLYVGGGSALAFIIWTLIPIKIVAVIIAAPVLLFFVALAFFKYNDRPFISTVENSVKYFFGPKLYIWQKQERKPIKKESAEKNNANLSSLPKLSDSKLKELTWSLDINKNIEDNENKNPNFKV